MAEIPALWVVALALLTAGMRGHFLCFVLPFAAAFLASPLALAQPTSPEASSPPSSYVQPASVQFPKTALQAGVGPTGLASTWRGDGGAGGSGRLGLLLFGVIAPDAVVRLSYATVDDRLLTVLSFGLTGYVPLRIIRPYARAAFVHQHEESRAAIAEAPGNAALGVGPGIRHRAGFAGALGAEAPIAQRGRSTFTFGGDVTASHFPDPRGPSTYVGGTLWITIHHAL